MFVVCCVGSGLCDELITRSEESYRVCASVCLIVCDLYVSTMRRPRPDLGCCPTAEKLKLHFLYDKPLWRKIRKCDLSFIQITEPTRMENISQDNIQCEPKYHIPSKSVQYFRKSKMWTFGGHKFPYVRILYYTYRAFCHKFKLNQLMYNNY